VYIWRFSIKHGSNHTVNLISTPTRVIDLSKECIVDIACGSDHFLALTSDGKVYTWGKNSINERDRYSYLVNTNLPREFLGGKKIVHIACNSIFNMGVTDKGILYGWGFYNDEQVLIDTTPFIINIRSSKSLPTVPTCADVQSQMSYMYPHEITAVSGKAIVKVACGLQHALALTDEGKLYAWGKNDRGQVGVNNNLQFSTPAMVTHDSLMKVEKLLNNRHDK
ncbi:rcc1 and btb domain-containing protein 1, partial [Lasius niger]